MSVAETVLLHPLAPVVGRGPICEYEGGLLLVVLVANTAGS